jgi:hypothetical protein
LTAVAVALLLVLLVLPSPLSSTRPDLHPQLEFAPVPPEERTPPPPDGNIEHLGLGSTAQVASPGDGGTGGAGAGGGGRGQGVSPSGKRCVGVPPRQTEDPTSPPCVSYFAGDNFGSTAHGVTATEVRILVYVRSDVTDIETSRGSEERPSNAYFDLFEPQNKDDHVIVRSLYALQRYFNDRFQTYGRTVHFFVYFASEDNSVESRRADAADNYARVHPFAVISDAGPNEVDYVTALARNGVLNFGSFAGRPAAFFQAFPKLVWGYQPTVEYQAHHFASYICRKVAGRTAVRSGNPGEAGRTRKLGLWHTADDEWPGLQLLARLVKDEVTGCGGAIDAEGTFAKCCIHQDYGSDPSYAANQMADFQQRGITTILWPGGVEGNAARAAATMGYFPEWIVLGDGTTETNGTPPFASQSASFDRRAVIVTPVVVRPENAQQQCSQAAREAEPRFPSADLRAACHYYDNLFQLFTGIQVAGPRLTPDTIDKGFHAIPAHPSGTVVSPACFYGVGDYTCVKDAQVELWDATMKSPDATTPGCWTLIEGGKRYLPDEWPGGNIDAQLTGATRCNGY